MDTEKRLDQTIVLKWIPDGNGLTRIRIMIIREEA